MVEDATEQELRLVDRQVTDVLPFLQDAGSASHAGLTLFDRFTQALCRRSRRTAVSFTFPRKGDSENVPSELESLGGETIVTVIEVIPRYLTNVIVLSGLQRELFRCTKDHSPGLIKPPIRMCQWFAWDRVGDEWDEKLKQLVELNNRSDLRRIWVALRLLQLAHRLGQQDELAGKVKTFFDEQDPALKKSQERSFLEVL